MRKITAETKKAWILGKNFRKSNTHLLYGNLYLFGNKIATRVYRKKKGSRDPEVFTEFNMQGYNTVTTRERLQAVGVRIRQIKGRPFFIQPNNDLVPLIDDRYYMVRENGYLVID